MSIAAVEQRLAAMLEELESGLRRSQLMDERARGYLAEKPRAAVWREHSRRILGEAKEQLSAEGRAAAIVILCGLASLTPSVTSWSLWAPASETAPGSEAKPVTAATATGATASARRDAAGAFAPPTSTPPAADAQRAGDAAPEGGKGTAASASEAGGLSIEEFNAEVRRLLAKKQTEPQAEAAASEPWLDGPLFPPEAPPPALEEPRPLPPPSPAATASAPPSTPPTTEATAQAEPVIPAETARSENPRPPVAAKAKAGGKGGAARARRAKAAAKTPAAAPEPAPAPTAGGPIAILRGATEALTGVVRDLGRVATGARR